MINQRSSIALRTLGIVVAAATPALSQSLAEPKVSPDGKQMVFIANATRETSYDIFVVGMNGQGLRRLACSAKADYQPSWSPSGEQIVFFSVRDGSDALYVHDLARASTRRLTPPAQHARGGVWSPDGKRIAYTVDAGGNENIWTIASDGSDARAITTGGNHYADVSWSPRGDRLLASAEAGQKATVVSMQLDGKDLRTIVDDTWGSPHGARWSPDGRSIAFHTNRTGNHEVYVMAADGTQGRQLTNNPARDFMSEWSRDGKELIVWSNRESPQSFYYLSLGDESLRKISATDGFSASAPCAESP